MAMTPQPAPKPAPPAPRHEAAKAEPALPIGAKPTDPKDPQAAKFEAHPVPPKWEQPKPAPEVEPDSWPDGMPVAEEQRRRSEEMQKHRPEPPRPDMKFDKDALSGGGAYVSAGEQSQVPGVAPPTKRN